MRLKTLEEESRRQKKRLCEAVTGRPSAAGTSEKEPIGPAGRPRITTLP